ncbi:MAG: hypothetical protein LBL80_01915 [Ruminococcus sp.]|jgi:hypothetical protein|nr:hypothetical protein [Ruminococcus sp.]
MKEMLLNDDDLGQIVGGVGLGSVQPGMRDFDIYNTVCDNYKRRIGVFGNNSNSPKICKNCGNLMNDGNVYYCDSVSNPQSV